MSSPRPHRVRPPGRTPRLLCLVAFAAGCLQQIPRRPDLGDCAGTAVGTYGEVPIGTCLAGPTDLQFVQREGGTWLAVSNADPFINFDGGSLLLIDWDDLVSGLDHEDLLVDELVAEALPTERFVAGMGWIEDRDLLLLTRRLTEGGRTRTGPDSAYVVQLDPLQLWPSGESIRLEEDPADVVVAQNGRAFALNLTDHSISVLDTTSTPIVRIDLAPEAFIAPIPLVDGDASGSVAELDRLELVDATLTPDDDWTLTFLPGGVRAWSPNGNGLDLWSSGGLDYVRSAERDWVDPGPFGLATLSDPVTGFVALDETAAQGSTILVSADGRIHRALGGPTGDDYTFDAVPLLARGAGWDMFRAGPTRTIANGSLTLYYDGTADGADTSAIGMATSDDGASWRARDLPILSPPTGESYEQPFAQIDARTGEIRMWLSMWNGFQYVVGHTSSADGQTFPEPVPVASLPGASLAAPAVRWVDGEYRMWAARDDGDRWMHVLIRSADGLVWGEPEPLFASEAPYDRREPPRLGIQAEVTTGWRVTGRENGQLSDPLVAGAQFVDASHGYRISIASGHELSNEIFPEGRAAGGLYPTSHVDVGGFDRLWVTTVGDDGAPRIGLLDGVANRWERRGDNLIPRGMGGNLTGASHAVVREIDGAWVMIYSGYDGDGVSRLFTATSPDGLTWTPVGEAILPDLGEWAGAAQEARTLELLDAGGARLWFAGSNGSRYRIGSVVTDVFDPTAPAASTWVPEPAEFTDWQLGTGLPGSVDDSGVKDPVVVTVGDQTWMYYAGFDGSSWHLARAVFVDGEWVRRIDPVTDLTLPAMSPVQRTFSAGGTDNPVARLRADGDFEIWYAGTDLTGPDGVQRLGRARSRGPIVFPQQRPPTAGDTLAFTTGRGDERVSAIELAQAVDDFRTTGTGTTSMIHDEDRGFLYVPSKLTNLLYVIDVRDDSTVDFVDANAMDLEALIRVPAFGGQNAFRGGVLHAGRDRLYLTQRNPDGIVVFDTSVLPDDDLKEVSEVPPIAVLPLQDNAQDEGTPTVTPTGGSHPALLGDLLLVPHFRDNSVSVFDLSAGGHGVEIAYLPHIGENPHRIAISPDGRWAVVANYLGDVGDDDLASSTLTLIDLDPTSPTWLQAVHRIVNQ